MAFLQKNYGLVERGHNIDIELEDTYKNFSKQQLKRELSRLKKFESDNVNKIEFVARLLCKTLAGNLNSTSTVTTIDHNAEIMKNLWNNVKNYVDGENQKSLLSLHLQECLSSNTKSLLQKLQITRMANQSEILIINNNISSIALGSFGTLCQNLE